MPDQIDVRALLKKLVNMLAVAITSEADYPSGLKLFGRLKAVENAAQLLLGEIADLRFRALLIDSNEWLENEAEGLDFLPNIAARVGQAQKRNPRNSGRGHPKTVRPASDGPSALELCALMVGITWHATNHRWPGQNNPTAHRWCENLWRAAGGAKHGAVARDGALTAWRNHLKAARQYKAPHPWGRMLLGIMAKPTPKRATPSPGLRSAYTYPRSREGAT